VSDTPETDELARGNHVVPTEFAQDLERDRTRIIKQDAETFLLALKYKRALDMIAEDCTAWLNNQCDETACEFIKAVRTHAQEVTK
jgi:hypothetical protein